MKESILIILLFLVSFIFFFMNKNNVIYAKSNIDNLDYLVRNDSNKQEAANLLSVIIARLFVIKDFLYNNMNEYPKYNKYIKRLYKNLNRNRTKIYETEKNSQYTSYSVNKGEELVFCLRSKEDDSFHDINLLMYVALHEISHIACPEIGHTPLFKKIFRFFTKVAIKIKIYKYDNYNNYPQEYCGMTLNSTIIN
jgi:hypothetical protein